MFERFTESARQVIVASQGEARALGQDHVGPHHLLLGVLRVDGATAAVVLEKLGIEPQDVRREAEARFGRNADQPPGHLPFSADSKNVLEHALRESIRLGHNYIGTEHLVLGLTEDLSEDTAALLAGVGADAGVVRDTVIARLASAGGAEPAEQ
jgi:ATP-dependent Clp protease ATP-binding subunit ClpC